VLNEIDLPAASHLTPLFPFYAMLRDLLLPGL
jgi:hypothetical protein